MATENYEYVLPRNVIDTVDYGMHTRREGFVSRPVWLAGDVKPIFVVSVERRISGGWDPGYAVCYVIYEGFMGKVNLYRRDGRDA